MTLDTQIKSKAQFYQGNQIPSQLKVGTVYFKRLMVLITKVTYVLNSVPRTLHSIICSGNKFNYYIIHSVLLCYLDPNQIVTKYSNSIIPNNRSENIKSFSYLWLEMLVSVVGLCTDKVYLLVEKFVSVSFSSVCFIVLPLCCYKQKAETTLTTVMNLQIQIVIPFIW